MSKLISITQLTNLLELTNKKSRKPQNHVLRYWEKEFIQIKPKILNKRRYYSTEQVELIKLIKYLIREKGITINGVKNILKKNINKLDDYNSDSLKTELCIVIITSVAHAIPNPPATQGPSMTDTVSFGIASIRFSK